ncbi:MAG TPA: glycosyltransferase family 39 protein [Jatrophihabitantaceae bacterium]|nr:glycosyltransferase family 39 protein [Jatrophihabitantaceae bacterium]
MTTAHAVSAEPPAAAQLSARLSGWVSAIALAQLAALLATSTRYGYHRDEMYFVVAGQHPAMGYPDQPPLVPLITVAMNHLATGSLLALRAPSALVAAATTVMAALIARECGGRARAQVIAAACTASSGFALAVGHFVTTSTFDLLSTTVVCWLVVRAVRRHSGPELLAAGVVTGVGFEAKPQVAFVAIVIVVALALVGPRWPLRSPWLFAGIGAALVLAAPYLIWQATHGWPQFTLAANIGGSAEGGRAGFVPFQLVMVSPVLVPVWLAGLVTSLRGADLRLRFIPVTYFLLAVVYLVGNGKAYYLASLYPVLLGIGAVPTAAWTLRRHPGLRTGLLAAGVVVSTAVSALVALPLPPARHLQGSVIMAINPDQGETVGWPRFVDTVNAAWQAIPAAERTHTVIFTGNYGESGAVDLLGHGLGLPRAYSGHNAFSEWGMPPQATQTLVLGYDGPTDTAPYFVDCHTVGKIDNGVGLDNDEQGLLVLLCRLAGSWTAMWPQLRHYN